MPNRYRLRQNLFHAVYDRGNLVQGAVRPGCIRIVGYTIEERGIYLFPVFINIKADILRIRIQIAPA
ncbi:hypothetical protein D3C75_1092630 [compost metagenome]